MTLTLDPHYDILKTNRRPQIYFKGDFMKKICSLILIVLTILSVLCSCAKGNTGDVSSLTVSNESAISDKESVSSVSEKDAAKLLIERLKNYGPQDISMYKSEDVKGYTNDFDVLNDVDVRPIATIETSDGIENFFSSLNLDSWVQKKFNSKSEPNHLIFLDHEICLQLGPIHKKTYWVALHNSELGSCHFTVPKETYDKISASLTAKSK